MASDIISGRPARPNCGKSSSDIVVFLSANTTMSVKPMWPSAVLAVPAALLASWAIVAGIFFGWFLLFSLPYSSVLAVLFASTEHFFPPVARARFSFGLLTLVPVLVGCTLGLLVHVAAASLTDQPLWDRTGRKTALAHCLGLGIGAGCVSYFFVAYIYGVQNSDLLRDSNRDADVGELIRFFWAMYFAAPALHLGCLWLARSRCGWPRGDPRVKRLLIICAVLYFAIGAARWVALGEPLALLTWPAHDIAGFAPRPTQPGS